MSKKYLSGMELLEVDGQVVGDHLSWLFCRSITKTAGKEAINSLVFNDDCPIGIWGMFHAPSRSIVINIQQHLGAIMDQIQDVKYMNTSVKVILIHELLDTIFHEAHHASTCAENENWEKGDLKEEDATEYAAQMSWDCAETLDVDVEKFGTTIDEFLTGLYQDLEEDVKEVNCKLWKRLQFHMLSNNVNYYNPDKGLEIVSVREVFEAQVQPKEAWAPTDDNSFHSYMKVNIPQEEVITEQVVIKPVAPITPVEPVTAVTTTATVTAAPSQPTMTVAEGYDPLDDICTEMVTEEEEYVPPATTTPVQQVTVAPVAQTTQVVAQTPQVVAPAQTLDIQRIQHIAELVMRRMFHHVFTKCEFNTAGGFNNVNAILEPISIADIDGATELFAKQDTLNDQGIFVSHADTNGMIKGLPTASGLPRYTFYMNIGGNMHKRVFIAQNPTKVNASGMPTAWATKAQSGGRIMMLLADNQGITAHAELGANQPLGQETFTIWSNKK